MFGLALEMFGMWVMDRSFASRQIKSLSLQKNARNAIWTFWCKSVALYRTTLTADQPARR